MSRTSKKLLAFDWYLLAGFLVTVIIGSCKKNANGDIFILNGASSAGKSSISRHLQEKYGFERVSHDNSLNNVLAKWIENRVFEKTGKKVSLGRNNPDLIEANFEKTIKELSLNESEFSWEKVLSDKQQKDLITKAAIEMIEDAKKYSRSGKSVIIEVTFDKKDFIKKQLSNFNMTFVLAYCPLEALVERVKIRNIKGGSEERTFVQALEQFGELYRARETEHEVVLDELSRERFEQIYKLTKKDFKLNEDENFDEKTNFDEKKYKKFITILEKNLGFYNETIGFVKITPRLSYDLIVNTGTNTPTESAEQIYHQ